MRETFEAHNDSHSGAWKRRYITQTPKREILARNVGVKKKKRRMKVETELKVRRNEVGGDEVRLLLSRWVRNKCRSIKFLRVTILMTMIRQNLMQCQPEVSKLYVLTAAIAILHIWFYWYKLRGSTLVWSTTSFSATQVTGSRKHFSSSLPILNISSSSSFSYAILEKNVSRTKMYEKKQFWKKNISFLSLKRRDNKKKKCELTFHLDPRKLILQLIVTFFPFFLFPQ